MRQPPTMTEFVLLPLPVGTKDILNEICMAHAINTSEFIRSILADAIEAQGLKPPAPLQTRRLNLTPPKDNR